LLIGAAAQLEQDPRFKKIASSHPKCLDREISFCTNQLAREWDLRAKRGASQALADARGDGERRISSV